MKKHLGVPQWGSPQTRMTKLKLSNCLSYTPKIFKLGTNLIRKNIEDLKL